MGCWRCRRINLIREYSLPLPPLSRDGRCIVPAPFQNQMRRPAHLVSDDLFSAVAAMRVGSGCHPADVAHRPSPSRFCRASGCGFYGSRLPALWFRYVTAASVGNCDLLGTGRRAICAEDSRGQLPNRPAFVFHTLSRLPLTPGVAFRADDVAFTSSAKFLKPLAMPL
jgi:hypothetical protein